MSHIEYIYIYIYVFKGLTADAADQDTRDQSQSGQTDLLYCSGHFVAQLLGTAEARLRDPEAELMEYHDMHIHIHIYIYIHVYIYKV